MVEHSTIKRQSTGIYMMFLCDGFLNFFEWHLKKTIRCRAFCCVFVFAFINTQSNNGFAEREEENKSYRWRNIALSTNMPSISLSKWFQRFCVDLKSKTASLFNIQRVILIIHQKHRLHWMDRNTIFTSVFFFFFEKKLANARLILCHLKRVSYFCTQHAQWPHKWRIKIERFPK